MSRRLFAIPDPEIARCPVYWFSIMDRAWRRGEFELAANAHRKLACLGVEVRYHRPESGRAGRPW
jgi:hypothetical protein